MEITTNLETNHDEYIDIQVLYAPFPGTFFTHSAKVSLLTSLQLSKQGHQLFSQSSILQGAKKIILSSCYAFKALAEVFLALSANLFWLFGLDYIYVKLTVLVFLIDQIERVKTIIKQKENFKPLTSKLFKQLGVGMIKVHLTILPVFFCFIGPCLLASIMPSVIGERDFKGLESILSLLDPSQAVEVIDESCSTQIGLKKKDRLYPDINDALQALSLQSTLPKIHAKKAILFY